MYTKTQLYSCPDKPTIHETLNHLPAPCFLLKPYPSWNQYRDNLIIRMGGKMHCPMCALAHAEPYYRTRAWKPPFFTHCNSAPELVHTAMATAETVTHPQKRPPVSNETHNHGQQPSYPAQTDHRKQAIDKTKITEEPEFLDLKLFCAETTESHTGPPKKYGPATEPRWTKTKTQRRLTQKISITGDTNTTCDNLINLQVIWTTDTRNPATRPYQPPSPQ